MSRKEGGEPLGATLTSPELTTAAFDLLQPAEEVLVVGFNITRNFELIRRNWTSPGDARILTSDLFGGAVLCLAIRDGTPHLLASVDVRTPLGFYYSAALGALLTCSDHWIYAIRAGQVARVINHRLFNCLHGISRSARSRMESVYIASTGIDAILEVRLDDSVACLWDWFATEHGYNCTPSGDLRSIDRSMKQQGVEYPTPTHTTHVNSVVQFDRHTILATLFHQGFIISIDLNSKLSRPVLKGLRRPHSIRRNKGGFLVCDTASGRVLVLDERLQQRRAISGAFDWIQDACELRDGTIAVADSNNHRVVGVNPSGRPVWERSYDADIRIGGLLPVTARCAWEVFCPDRRRARHGTG